MRRDLYLIFLTCFCTKYSFGFSSCPVDFFIIEKNNGMVELGLRNNMDKSYSIQYDKLPWVLLGGGVDFNVEIDGRRVQKAIGVGHNTLILKLGAKSLISSEVNLNYLKSFYTGIDVDRVSISWTYNLPAGDNFDVNCSRFKGNIKTP